MDIRNVLKSVLKKIKPTEREVKKVNEFLINLKEVAKVLSDKYGGKPIVCGSLGKDTWIRSSYDIDLFIVFPKSLPRSDLEKYGLVIGKKIISQLGGEWSIKYAEHPYVRGLVNGFDIDIVPCYEMSFGDKILSAVDRSPLHTEYMINHLSDKHRDEVRLLKKFFKSMGVYGSDVKTEGISGYILEILVLKFNTFENVLKFFRRAKFGEIVDIEDFWRGKPPRAISRYPLVVIDPVDKHRNAAAALSSQNFYMIKKFSEKFLSKPSERMFFKKWSPVNVKKLSSRDTHFTSLVMPRDKNVVDDTLYPQLRKASKRISSYLKDFGVIRTFAWADDKKAIIIFELRSSKLPAIEKKRGPSVFSREHSERFLKKHAGDIVYIENDVWYAETKRRFKTPEKALKKIISMKYADAISFGIPSHVAKSIKKSTVVSDKKLFNIIKETKDLSKELNKFYSSLSVGSGSL